MRPTSSSLARRRRIASDAEPSSGSTRDRIVDAAIATLREEGFAGTSARAIARRGAFNQALIFYHFGSVLDLLVTTLERMSDERLAQYRAAVANVRDLRAAVAVAREQYALDVSEGHITVLAEMVAAASSVPQLGPEIVRCMEPWIRFAQESISRFVSGTSLERLIPSREAAHALLAIYLGMELLDHLDPGANRAEPLFAVAERMLAALEPFMGVDERAANAPASRRPRRVRLDSGEPPRAEPV